VYSSRGLNPGRPENNLGQVLSSNIPLNNTFLKAYVCVISSDWEAKFLTHRNKGIKIMRFVFRLKAEI
jgi:hypothetical protein